jgi:hypothetical protein
MATKAKGKKPAKKKKPPAPSLTAAEQKEFERKTRALTDEIRERRAKMEDRRESFKEAKAMLAGSISELERVTYDYTHPEALPLFRDNANGKPVEPLPVEGDWKAVTLREALPDMPGKFYELCEKQQLETIGKLIDWKNAKSFRWWKDLGKGVGKACFDKLDDAIEAFFARVEATDPVVPEPAKEEPEKDKEPEDEPKAEEDGDE